MEAVCGRLVDLRLALGLKQKDIAGRAGLSTTQWANYEKLSRMPNVQDMVRLADEVGASLDYIYRGLASALPHDLALKLTNLKHDLARSRSTEETPVTFGEARAKRA